MISCYEGERLVPIKMKDMIYQGKQTNASCRIEMMIKKVTSEEGSSSEGVVK